ncbi:efflux RND transporter periplasmic adaptor subunit [Salinisphaera sp. SPP-AMP-43]|uniref:efflux RND transporter periplasmic adaptor subunit n=1 Tax=Salinisphaera sp. SPP-AMP-43 TaxID=3121288 RepID=UPI003C6DE5DC
MTPDSQARPSIAKRMLVMIGGVVLLIALIAGIKVWLVMRTIASLPKPSPATVSTTTVRYQNWQPRLSAVGTLRAVRGADLAFDVPGLVQNVALQSGQRVAAGQLLVRLHDADDVAQLHQLEAAAHLATLNFRRARRQVAANAISTADYESAESNMTSRQAAVAEQQALIAKKHLRAPFAGRAGIITINPGDYLPAGTPVVTLQQLDALYIDFDMPQRELGRLAIGQRVRLAIDAFTGQSFAGQITAIEPRVNTDTRNIRVEARIPNPNEKLFPGMFAEVQVEVGAQQRYLTLPQAAIVYNPYGDTVFVVQRTDRHNEQGEPALPTVQQTLVTTGDTRGDQIAVTHGLNRGAEVVTSGQLKLKNGAEITIDNSVQPADAAHPRPQER